MLCYMSLLWRAIDHCGWFHIVSFRTSPYSRGKSVFFLLLLQPTTNEAGGGCKSPETGDPNKSLGISYLFFSSLCSFVSFLAHILYLWPAASRCRTDYEPFSIINEFHTAQHFRLVPQKKIGYKFFNQSLEGFCCFFCGWPSQRYCDIEIEYYYIYFSLCFFLLAERDKSLIRIAKTKPQKREKHHKIVLWLFFHCQKKIRLFWGFFFLIFVRFGRWF